MPMTPPKQTALRHLLRAAPVVPCRGASLPRPRASQRPGEREGCDVGFRSHLLRLSPFGRLMFSGRSADCAIASWRRPTGSSTANSLFRYRRGLSTSRGDNRSPSPTRRMPENPANSGKQICRARRSSRSLSLRPARIAPASVAISGTVASRTDRAFCEAIPACRNSGNHSFAMYLGASRHRLPPPPSRICSGLATLLDHARCCRLGAARASRRNGVLPCLSAGGS